MVAHAKQHAVTGSGGCLSQSVNGNPGETTCLVPASGGGAIAGGLAVGALAGADMHGIRTSAIHMLVRGRQGAVQACVLAAMACAIHETLLGALFRPWDCVRASPLVRAQRHAADVGACDRLQGL